MTNAEMFKGAKWIDISGCEAPIFYRAFTAKAKEKAEITICGLGFFKLYINGKKVSDDLLVPNASDYSERDKTKFAYPLNDRTSHRIYCLKYDISDYLKDGENALEVMLGCGYYSQEKGNAEGFVSFGMPKLCYVIEKESGNVLCDKNTLGCTGFITKTNLYEGEEQDYTLIPAGFLTGKPDKSRFNFSREIDAPQSDYLYQFGPSDKVCKTLTPELIEEKDGIRLYDTGINTVGYAVIKCKETGKKITVSYAEDIYDKPNFGIHFSDGYQTEVFITDGEDREYIPHFTWHGFRYIKVEGPGEIIRVDVVHSDCKITSSFECDNAQLNWLYNTYIHTQLCNMHCGVPSDCPHRERLGYTGDGQLCAEAAMLTLDSKSFYRKWLEDIADCQCPETGHVQHTAPLMGGGGGPCGWGGAVVEVPYRYYKIYGDKEVLEEFFPKILKYFDYLESRSDYGLVCREEEGGWCLGDWLPPEPIKIPEAYVNTCLYIRFLQQAAEIAAILGKDEYIPKLEKLAEEKKKAVNAAYFSFQQGAYCGDVQGTSCLALSVGLGNEKVKNNVIKKYKKLGMYDTGIICTDVLTGYLFDIGEAQTAFELMSGKKEVSFDFMARNGATTLWENWNGESSKNHPMFGAVTKYLFTRLLGIRQPSDSAGFEKIIISPMLVSGLNRCKGYITTEKGKISVEYEKSTSNITFNISVPEKCECEFVLGDFKQQIFGKAEITVNI